MLLKFRLFFLLMLFNILSILASDDNLYMSAENFFKDEKNNFIRANGNVEIKKGSIFIHADSLIYNIEKKEILLEGNVRILTETGEVVFAKKAKLNEKLQDGVITNLGVLLSDGSRLASREALTSKNNKKTVYKKTVFTKCKSCEDDGSVLWQIKSKKASHLKDRKIIVYEAAKKYLFEDSEKLKETNINIHCNKNIKYASPNLFYFYLICFIVCLILIYLGGKHKQKIKKLF